MSDVGKEEPQGKISYIRKNLHETLDLPGRRLSPSMVVSFKPEPHQVKMEQVIREAHGNVDIALQGFFNGDKKAISQVNILEKIATIECLVDFLNALSPDLLKEPGKKQGITETEYVERMFFEQENRRSAEEILKKPGVVTISNLKTSIEGVTITIERDENTAREKSGSGSFSVLADHCYDLNLQFDPKVLGTHTETVAVGPDETGVRSLDREEEQQGEIDDLQEKLPDLIRQLDQGEMIYSRNIAHKLAEPFLERIQILEAQIVELEMRKEGASLIEGKKPTDKDITNIFIQRELGMNAILRDLFEEFVYIQQGEWLPVGREDHSGSPFEFSPSLIADMLIAKVFPKMIITNKRDSHGEIIPLSNEEKFELTKKALMKWHDFADLFRAFSFSIDPYKMSDSARTSYLEGLYYDQLLKVAQQEPKPIPENQEEYFESILDLLKKKKPPQSDDPNASNS